MAVGRLSARALFSLFPLVACVQPGVGTGETTTVCPVGSTGCVCTAGGACDEGLVCLSDLCVDYSPAEDGEDSAGAESQGTETAAETLDDDDSSDSSGGESGSAGDGDGDAGSAGDGDGDEGVSDTGDDGSASAGDGDGDGDGDLCGNSKLDVGEGCDIVWDDDCLADCTLGPEVEWHFEWDEGAIYGMTVDVDGRILVVGERDQGGGDEGFVQRFLPDGSTDFDRTLSFTPRGVGTSPVDTSFVVVGHTGNLNVGAANMRMVRFNANDSLTWDQTVDSADPEYSHDTARDVYLDAAGDVFIAGEYERKAHVWRYSLGGVLKMERNIGATGCSDPPVRAAATDLGPSPTSGNIFVSLHEGECDDPYSTRRVLHLIDPIEFSHVSFPYLENYWGNNKEMHAVGVRSDAAAVFGGDPGGWVAARDESGLSLWTATYGTVLHDIEIGPNDIAATVGSSDQGDYIWRAFLRVYDVDGTPLFTRMTHRGDSHAVAFGADGSIYVGGSHNRGGSPIVSPIFLRKYSPLSSP